VSSRPQRIEVLTDRSFTDPVGLAEICVAATAARLTLTLEA
jgi:hypothetical protein